MLAEQGQSSRRTGRRCVIEAYKNSDTLREIKRRRTLIFLFFPADALLDLVVAGGYNFGIGRPPG